VIACDPTKFTLIVEAPGVFMLAFLAGDSPLHVTVPAANAAGTEVRARRIESASVSTVKRLLRAIVNPPSDSESMIAGAAERAVVLYNLNLPKLGFPPRNPGALIALPGAGAHLQ
jgi:hypothetical protein